MRHHTWDIFCDLYGERLRQEEVEGYTREHDDRHDMAELGRAAAAYTVFAAAQSLPTSRQGAPLRHRAGLLWPFDGELKPHPPRRALIIAGALAMAEIERLDRLSGYHAERYRDDAASRRFDRARDRVDAAYPPGRELP